MILSPTQHIKESAKFIHQNSSNVSIPPLNEAISKIISILGAKDYKNSYSLYPGHPHFSDKNVLNHIFLIDLLNFSFWGNFSVTYDNYISCSGYKSLTVSIMRAISNGIDIVNPSFYSTITKSQCLEIFKGDADIEIPLIDKRVDVLNKAGTFLVQKYGGDFTNCVKMAQKSADKLLELIMEIPSFDDVPQYKGKRVFILKRAQILVADIWACFGGKGLGEFVDIDNLTMFADYRVPQALVALGALQYTEEFMDELKKEETSMTYGCEKEVEIRGCSIHSVELITLGVNKIFDAEKKEKVNSIIIDFALWEWAKENSEKLSSIPIHKTRSIYY
jgi:hypothetical protein